jgi:opacity protein-like surface antigen
MRIFYMLAALAALWVQPAKAATFVDFAVSAYLSVTRTTDYGWDQSTYPASCGSGFTCTTSATSLEHISFGYVPGSSVNGTNFSFEVFNPIYRAHVGGTATYLGNGVYKGVSLSYSEYPLFLGSFPFTYGSGSTSTFSIHQVFPAPVPEPTTWALMLLGFGVIGYGLRRRNSFYGAQFVPHARAAGAPLCVSRRVHALLGFRGQSLT